MDNDDESALMKALQEENAESPIRNDFLAFLGTSPPTHTSSNVDEAFKKALQEENAESPIRNDFGAFLGTSPPTHTSSNVVGVSHGTSPPTHTTSNVFLGLTPTHTSSNESLIAAAQQEVFNKCIGTNNFGSNAAHFQYKTLTENDLNSNNLIFESKDWKKAQLANTLGRRKDIHVVDPVGIWRTVEWESRYWTDEKEKILFCCEIKDWKVFAQAHALETGDKVHLYTFKHNKRDDLYALGYVKKQVKMPTSNPQNPYVNPFDYNNRPRYVHNSPFPDATLSNQLDRLQQITVPRASVFGSTFHTAGSSSSNPLPLVDHNPTSNLFDYNRNVQQHNSPFPNATLLNQLARLPQTIVPHTSVFGSTAGSSSANPLPLVDHNRTSTDTTLVGNQQQNTAPGLSKTEHHPWATP